MLTRLGNSRDQPRGIVQPWKSTSSWNSAASRRRSRYCWIRSCLSLCQKSTLTPLTPQSRSLRELRAPLLARRHAVARRLGDVVVRAAGVVPEEQARRPSASRARCTSSIVPVCITFQFASTSAYSQPISAARSVKAVQRLGVLRAVALRPPAPRGAAGLHPAPVAGPAGGERSAPDPIRECARRNRRRSRRATAASTAATTTVRRRRRRGLLCCRES